MSIAEVLVRLIESPDGVPDVAPQQALTLLLQLSALQTRLAIRAANGVGAGGDAGPVCYDMREVASRLKMDPSTVYKLAKRGELATFKQGRAVRVRREDLERFMQQRLIT